MRKIVITGASEGIGKSIALQLGRDTANELVLVARSQEKLETVISEIEALGGVATYKVCDLGDRAQIKNVVESIGAIDVLINNAGVWHKMSQLDEISDETIEQVLNVNLAGHIFMTKHFLPSLRKSDSAALINIISKSGVTAQGGQTAYTASKWGMKGFTEVLRTDLKDTDIRIGAVYQAGTATGMFSKTGEQMPEEKFTDPNDLASVISFMLNQPDKIWLNEVHVTY